MANETWKAIKDFEGLYEVSNLGNVRSLDAFIKHSRGGRRFRKGRVLIQKIIWSGYMQVCLCKNGKKYNKSVHRLVSINFISNHENKPTVNHIDGNKKNNSVSNLEWATVSENNKHAYSIGIKKATKYWTGKMGADNIRSIPIIQKDMDGNIISKYSCSAEAGRKLKLDENSISRASRGVSKTAFGFIWERII